MKKYRKKCDKEEVEKKGEKKKQLQQQR